ncbi:hypothetical protein K431DRAFT_293479 [Polychaeton citri CBS 116435]|uniref:RNA ligase/cyclic nucleotide phosphodiesterase n=1 Tax=Polychaeton citri CBS 116435 TaxID=1314669 RepID=A0A9P4Q819_9PEZI|nr:hypothetical protein K431DRAFT_293479 [Polychaeton citri CBS 116435]
MAAYYTFEDYSGTSTPNKTDNPYQDLIEICENDPSKIQEKYDTHRTNRAAAQKAKLSSPDFSGVLPDVILAKLEDPRNHPGFQDPRNCLVFWAHPPPSVRVLAAEIQKRLKQAAPSLWTMPPNNLHMTALEITHSLTAPEIDALVDKMLPSVPDITDFTLTHRARVVKPTISYDAQALALSYLPASGEPGRSEVDDKYSYHHLRRDLFTKASATGVKVASRYVVPSAHLTVARFVNQTGFETADGKVDHQGVQKLIQAIEEINAWLEKEYWPQNGTIKSGGEWVIGEERGLEYRKGTLWYGSGGQTVHLGEGF